jgi:hypothetical protein
LIKNYVTAVLIAALLTITSAQTVSAAPVIGALVSFIGFTGFAATVATTVLTTALYFGASLLLQSMNKPKLGKSDPGITFEIQMGELVPLAFPMGKTATGGSRNYIGTWGNANGTPNAYLTDEIEISDIIVTGQPGLFINGKRATILWGETPVAQGYPIQEFRVSGTDYAWAYYVPGSAVTADAFLRDKFGSHPERPYTSAMIGRGVSRLVVTTLVNRELFTSGNIQCLVEPPLSKWYDIRKDSTNGGSGAHRWNDQSTWEASDNPVVLIYNIIRGIYYGSEWIYGGNNLPAFRLPAANWIAAANECDVLVDIPGGGTEKQYRAGIEVRVDIEPLTVIEELKKACCARVAEIGGLFKIQINVPNSAVYSFTSGDIVITDPQQDLPFPTFDNTYNGVEIVYPEPDEVWSNKDAPAIYDSALELADGQRKLAPPITLKACPFKYQVQRVGAAIHADNRRFRHHVFVLPPDAKALEPNDCVSITDTDRGYTNKKFLIHQIMGRRDSNIVATIKECDPADFDPETVSYQTPVVNIPGQVRPPAQTIAGFQAFPDVIQNVPGSKQRPSIRVEFPAGLHDIRAVNIQARLAGETANSYDAETAYADIPTLPGNIKAVVLNGTFLPDEDYEVSAKLIPFSSRDTIRSSWLAVTTPNVGITEAELDTSTQGFLELARELASRLQKVERRLQEVGGAVILEQQIAEEKFAQIFKGVGVQYNQNKALAEFGIASAADANNALSTIFGSVIAKTNAGEAQSIFQMDAISSEDLEGAFAGIKLGVTAGFGSLVAAAVMKMYAQYTAELGLHSRIAFEANQIDLIVGGTRIPAFGLQRGDEAKELFIVGGEIIVDLRTAHKAYYCRVDATAKIVFPLGASPGKEFVLILENVSALPSPITIDTTYTVIGSSFQQPSTTGGVYSFYRGIVGFINPPVLSLKLENFGATTSASDYIFSISPPIDGVSIINLAAGPLEILGPVAGAPDEEYVITPLGNFLKAVVVLQAPGGTSGSIWGAGGTVTHPATPNDTTLTSPNHVGFGTLTAQAGRSSSSRAASNDAHTNGAAAGNATGGDTNENGSAGANGYQDSINPATYGVFGGAGGNSPSANGPGYNWLPWNGSDGVGFTSNGSKEGIEGDDPGAGASGPALIYATWQTGIGGAGGGARVTKEYDEFTSMIKDKTYIVKLSAPKAPVVGNINAGDAYPGDAAPNGKAGGRSKFTLTAA